MGAPKDRADTLRPPEPGTEETITFPRRAPSAPPPRPTSSWPPPRDARSEAGGGIYAEVARGLHQARAISMPEPPPPDRSERIAALVAELARSGPETDLPLRQRLLALGPECVPALARAFPGAFWVDLGRPHRPLVSARQVSAIAACLGAFGAASAPHVPALLRAPRSEVRLAAALVGADLADGSLVRPLAARLWDDVVAVRNAAMIALRASAHLAEARALRSELVTALEDPKSPIKWRKKAVWTLGQLRDVAAAPLLVEQLAAEPDVASIARDALRRIVGRDLGRFRVRWRAFFRKNEHRSRPEWLIDALDQADSDARMRAVEELVLATGEGFERRRDAATRDGARELASYYRRALDL